MGERELSEVMENSSVDIPVNNTYCPVEYEIFWQNMEPIVLNLNLFICCVGITTNFLSLLVFTRKPMINSTNVLLAAISASDLIVMTFFIPQYVSQLKWMRAHHAYSTAVIWVIHEYFTSVFHPVSTWVTCTVAIWRYIAVIHPFKSKLQFKMVHAKIIICVIVLISIIICVPSYLPNSVNIVETDENASWKEGGCGSSYCSYWTSYNWLRKIELWYLGCVAKVVPAIILTFVSVRLIRALMRTRDNRRVMRSIGSISIEPSFRNKIDSTSIFVGEYNKTELKSQVSDSKSTEENHEFRRTTKMLIVIILLFVFTEIPPGILYVLETFFGADFYFECRRPIHYFLLTMYYLSGFMNFIVYIIMSRNYRSILFQLIRLERLKKTFRRVTSSHNESE